MRVSREIMYKWLSYAFCILLLLFLRLLFIPNWTVWGVMPFLPPLLLATVASLEDTRGAVIFGIVFGVFCDLLFHAPLPCLYTLAFTVAALLSALLSQRFLQAGFFCAVVVSVLTFSVVAALNILSIGFHSQAELSSMLFLYVREMLVSLIFLILCYPLLSFLHRFFEV